MQWQQYPPGATPEVPDRRRRWHVRRLGVPPQPIEVVARYVIDDLEPDEQINDSPPTVSMTLAEWEWHHADFGHTADFIPVP